MQVRYREMAGARNLLSGPLGASARDLSTLFVVRGVELYLRDGGRFAFVMPWGTLTRKPHDGFRSGSWARDSDGASVAASFTNAWDLLDAARATGFPMVSCVVRGTRTTGSPVRLPAVVEAWTVKSSKVDATWPELADKTTRAMVTRRQLAPGDADPVSPYKTRFRSGAIIYPKVLVVVERVAAGPLGVGAGRVRVRTVPSTQRPWRSVSTLEGVVEEEFVHPYHVGADVLPFRMLPPKEAVLPISKMRPDAILNETAIQEAASFGRWWENVEAVWREHRVRGEKLPLHERLDHSRQLSAQLPIDESATRVVYTASGSQLTAALVRGPAIIEHGLYWATAHSPDEARYLAGILNSTTLKDRVAPLQAVGLFGPRHFDKVVFDVPFPAYDGANQAHRDLVAVVQECEGAAASVDVSGVTFIRARKLVWEALVASGLAARLNKAADAVLPSAI